MKFSNTIDEKTNDFPVIDFLDSLDTDIDTSIEASSVQSECSDDTTVLEPTEEELTNENNSQEITALVVTKPNSLFVAQKMFKKSIKISIKSFLISLSLGFLNLFL